MLTIYIYIHIYIYIYYIYIYIYIYLNLFHLCTSERSGTTTNGTWLVFEHNFYDPFDANLPSRSNQWVTGSSCKSIISTFVCHHDINRKKFVIFYLQVLCSSFSMTFTTKDQNLSQVVSTPSEPTSCTARSRTTSGQKSAPWHPSINFHPPGVHIQIIDSLVYYLVGSADWEGYSL